MLPACPCVQRTGLCPPGRRAPSRPLSSPCGSPRFLVGWAVGTGRPDGAGGQEPRAWKSREACGRFTQHTGLPEGQLCSLAPGRLLLNTPQARPCIPLWVILPQGMARATTLSSEHPRGLGLRGSGAPRPQAPQSETQNDATLSCTPCGASSGCYDLSGSHRKRTPAKHLQSALECAIRKAAPSARARLQGEEAAVPRPEGHVGPGQEATSWALSSGSLLSRDPSRPASLSAPAAQPVASSRVWSPRMRYLHPSGASGQTGPSLLCLHQKPGWAALLCTRPSLCPSEKCPVLLSKAAPAPRV